MVDMYYQHVYPHLIYAIPIWGTDNERQMYIKPLIRVHKRIVRIISRANFNAHTLPLMNKRGILSITNLYKFRSCAEMHAYIHPKRDLNRPQHDHVYKQTENVHQHATRHAVRNVQYTDNNQEHFTKKYIKLWNSLPDSVRSTKSYTRFKKELKTYLIAEQIQKVN